MQQVRAETECNITIQAPSIMDVVYIPNNIEDRENLNCHNLALAHQTIKDLNDIFRDSPKIFLHLYEEFDNPTFDQGYILRYTQKYLRKSKSGSLHESVGEELTPILVHEYGHAIIRDRWQKRFPKFESFFDLTRELSLSVNKAVKLQNHKHEIDEKEYELRQTELDQQSEQTAHLIDLNPYYFIFAELIPYNELLADVIATYFLDNKYAISSVIDHPSYSETERSYVLSRQFQRPASLELEHETDHTILREVRYHIGENYMPRDNKEKQDFFNKIAVAVENEIQRIYLDFEGEPDNLAQDLIKEIDKQFSEI